MICRKCGRKNLDGSQSCVYCGMSMEPTLPKEPAAPAEPVLDGQSSGSSLSATMIANIKAESAVKAKTAIANKGDDGTGAGSAKPGATKAVAAKADGAKAGSTKAGSAKAGGAKTGSASAGFPPPPSARPSARPSPLSPPTTKKDSADEDFEMPEVSAKTKRNVIIGIICFLAFIFIGPMLNQCSDLMTAVFDDDSFDSWSINVENGKTSNSNSSSSSSYDYMSVLITPEAEKRGVEDYENPVVILDEKELKITINVGSGGNRAITGYLDFECIIENKTNKTAGLFFEDISADGFSGNKYNVGFFRKESRQGSTGAFAPGENEAYLSFAEDTVFGDITSLTGRIMFFERGTGEEIKRYTLSIAML